MNPFIWDERTEGTEYEAVLTVEGTQYKMHWLRNPIDSSWTNCWYSKAVDDYIFDGVKVPKRTPIRIAACVAEAYMRNEIEAVWYS